MEDRSSARFIILFLCLFFIVPQILLMVRIYTHYLCVVILTNRKIHIFKRTLLTLDRYESVDIAILQDMHKLQRSIVQSILGFGTLQLDAPMGIITIHFTPHIDSMHALIIQLREEARQKLAPQPADQKPPTHQTS